MSATQTRSVLAGLAGFTAVLIAGCSPGTGVGAVTTGGSQPASPTQLAVEAVAAASPMRRQVVFD